MSNKLTGKLREGSAGNTNGKVGIEIGAQVTEGLVMTGKVIGGRVISPVDGSVMGGRVGRYVGHEHNAVQIGGIVTPWRFFPRISFARLTDGSVTGGMVGIGVVHVKGKKPQIMLRQENDKGPFWKLTQGSSPELGEVDATGRSITMRRVPQRHQRE